MDAICTQFTKSYSNVSLEFKNEDTMGYEFTILLLHLKELEKGYKVKKDWQDN